MMVAQTQEVTTVRFYVRDSFEEVSYFDVSSVSFLILRQQVLKVQDSKKYLACLLLSPHDD